MQRCRAARYRNRMSRPDIRRELAFELLQPRAEAQVIAAQHILHGGKFRLGQIRRRHVDSRHAGRLLNAAARIGLAGTPTTVRPAATSWRTSAPAPTMLPAPIVTPGMTVAPMPTSESSPTLTAPPVRTPGPMWTWSRMWL